MDLDLGIEELGGGRGVSLEHLAQAREVDRLESTVGIKPPEAKSVANDLNVLPGHRPSIPG
jgi:hypothetical protein